MTPDIRHLAILARLDISDEEIADFSSQLARILDYAAVVSRVTTDGVEPMSHADAGEEPLRWRDDVPRPAIARETVLDAAPDANVPAGLFRVPKVL